jgi:Transposase, Mutator family
VLHFLGPIVEAVLQELLEAEMNATLGAARGERTAARLGYCSGYYGRTLAMFLRPTVRRRHAVVELVQTTSNLEGEQGILCRTTVAPQSFLETEVRCCLCQGEVPCVLYVSEVILTCSPDVPHS